VRSRFDIENQMIKITIPRTGLRFLVALVVVGLIVPAFPAPTATASALPPGEYIVQFDASSNLGAKIRTEMQHGNSISEVLNGSDGIVATLDSGDLRRLQADPDVIHIEKNQSVSILEPLTVVATQKYIVRFSSTKAASNAVSSLGLTTDHVFRTAFSGFVAYISAAQLAAIKRDPSVVAIESDSMYTLLETQSNAPWGLDRIDQRSVVPSNTYTPPNSGAGVSAYIVDTGILATHVEFGNRVRSGFSAIDDGYGTSDCHGHGTHVAGIVGGTTYGVAKSVSLIPVRIMACSGGASLIGILTAFEWMITDHAAGTPAVANMSFGGGYSSILNTAVENVIADGIVVAVAAGNSSLDACSISPASTPSALTVAASTVSDTRASFSNFGSCVDLFAPGSSILSSYIGSNTATTPMSGTSMSSPFVAGAAALELSAHPTKSVTQVNNALINASTTNVIVDAGLNSPNRLLYVSNTGDTNPPPTTTTTTVPAPILTNDNFAQASLLVGDLGSAYSNTRTATLEQGEPSHGSGGSASIWFSWTAPESGLLTLTTAGSSYDTLLATYSGSNLSTLINHGQNDDVGGGIVSSRLVIPVVADQTYKFAVDGYGGQRGDVVLNHLFQASSNSPLPATPNDSFAAAQEISGSSGNTIGNSTMATTEPGEPLHGPGASASVWYSWTAPADGIFTATTQGSDFDTLLAVYSGTALSSLTQLASNDDSSGYLWSRVSIPVVSGKNYKIAVDGWGTRKGSVALLWSFVIPPPPAAPSEPRSIAISPDDGSLFVGWNAPLSDGRSIITEYVATASPGNASCNTTGSLGCIITGLTNGTNYTVTVTAKNEIGTSAPSLASASTIPLKNTGSTSPRSWGLDRIDQRSLPLDATLNRPVSGTGVTVYIIDTGIYAGSFEFMGRVRQGFTAIEDSNGTNDCQGHGTHVAGTAAGRTYGVAPGATLVPVRVLDCFGSGTTAGVIAGIDWMINDHQSGVPAVANMSLGGGYSPMMNAAIARATADGIVMVVAGGNESSDACGVSPASAPEAITVGATAQNDSIASFSNVGTCLDIFAPGVSITSAGITGPGATNTFSGTSMAAPHVAGAVALLLSQRTTATPNEITSTLVTAATANVVSGNLASAPNKMLFIGLYTPPPQTTTTTTTTAPPTTTTSPPVPDTTIPESTTTTTIDPSNLDASAPTTTPTRTKSASTNSIRILTKPTVKQLPSSVVVTKRTAKAVTIKIIAKSRAKVKIYRNGVLFITTTKRKLTLVMPGALKAKITVTSTKGKA